MARAGPLMFLVISRSSTGQQFQKAPPPVDFAHSLDGPMFALVVGKGVTSCPGCPGGTCRCVVMRYSWSIRPGYLGRLVDA